MPWFNGTGKHSYLGDIDREAMRCDATCKIKGQKVSRRVGEPHKLVLPPNKAILLMVVKHSLHWLYSCCTGRSHSITLGRKKEGLCATSRIRGNPITPTPFQDMVEMWNKWHSAYLDAGLPVTWLRYEDLIFAPEDVIADTAMWFAFLPPKIAAQPETHLWSI
jgi:hypothetical protein